MNAECKVVTSEGSTFMYCDNVSISEYPERFVLRLDGLSLRFKKDEVLEYFRTDDMAQFFISQYDITKVIRITWKR